MGLAFLMETAYLLPLTGFFLLVSVGALGIRARQRRGYGPFVVGIAAAVLLLVGKFVFDSNVAVYGGIAVLIVASGWNAWPTKQRKGVFGTPTGTLYQVGSKEV